MITLTVFTRMIPAFATQVTTNDKKLFVVFYFARDISVPFTITVFNTYNVDYIDYIDNDDTIIIKVNN